MPGTVDDLKQAGATMRAAQRAAREAAQQTAASIAAKGQGAPTEPPEAKQGK